MNKPHPSANLLIAIAQGKQMQTEGVTELWADATLDEALFAIYNEDPCRVKPDFVLVNGIECPKPIVEGLYTYILSIMVREAVQGDGTELVLGFDTHKDAMQVFLALAKPFKG